jgi:hypothetical protein
MDRKEERRNRFNRKKKFKKLTGSKKVRAETKKIKGNSNDISIWNDNSEHRI